MIVLQKYFSALGDTGRMFDAMMAEVREDYLSAQNHIKENETE